jgi:hypothetical protein
MEVLDAVLEQIKNRFTVYPPPHFGLPPPPPRRRHAAANVALSHCRLRRSLRAAATALPPLRCAPPLPRFALLPLPIGVSGSRIRVFFSDVFF